MELLLEKLGGASSHTDDKLGVDAVGGALRGYLEGATAAQLHTEVKSSTRFGDQRCFYTSATGSKPGVVLIGHSDTVFPADVWSGYCSDGTRAYGPGVL